MDIKNTDIQEVGRILYYEPNKKNGEVFNPEDYSIFVDLVVETTNRLTRKKSKAEANFDGKTLIFKGNHITSTSRNYLSTNVLNNTFQDIREGNNKECLGIEYIDIAFNSWNCPEVNIKFTDVRGASLLSPADYYDNRSVYGTYGDGGRNEEDFESSLISSFFKFPYPKYSLRIKGFYGKAVTYQLCVTDFKTSFNSSTGNFDINVKFIGYMFGFFTDIPFNFLYAAPFMSTGKKYWELSDFTFETGSKIPTLSELRKTLQDAGKTVDEDPNCRAAVKQISNERVTIDRTNDLHERFDDFVKEFPSITITTQSGVSSNNNRGESREELAWDIMFLPSKSSFFFDDKKNGINIESKYSAVAKEVVKSFEILGNDGRNTKQINEFINAVKKGGGSGKYKPENLTVKIFTVSYENDKFTLEKLADDENSSKTLPCCNKSEREEIWKKIDESKAEIEKLLARNYSNLGKDYTSFYAIYFPKSKIDKEIDSITNLATTEIENKKGIITSKKNSVIRNLIGFEPTIKNIVDIVLAHMDTAMHVIYDRVINRVAEKDNRKDMSRYGLTSDNTDINTKDPRNTAIPPFFTYYNTQKKDSKGINSFDTISKNEEMWIGDNPLLKNFDEVAFIKEYASALSEIDSEKREAEKTINDIRNGKDENLIYLLPIDNMDEIVNPYDGLIDDAAGDESMLEKVKKTLLYRTLLYKLFYKETVTSGNTTDNTWSHILSVLGEIEATAFSKTAAFIGLNDAVYKSINDDKTVFPVAPGSTVTISGGGYKRAVYNKEKIPIKFSSPDSFNSQASGELGSPYEKALISVEYPNQTSELNEMFSIATEPKPDFDGLVENVKGLFSKKSIGDSPKTTGYFTRGNWGEQFYVMKYLFDPNGNDMPKNSALSGVTRIDSSWINGQIIKYLDNALANKGFKDKTGRYLPAFAVNNSETLFNHEVFTSLSGETADLARAYLFLNTLPLKFDGLTKILRSMSTRAGIISLPKGLVLLLGALYWRKSLLEDCINWGEYAAPGLAEMPRQSNNGIMNLSKDGKYIKIPEVFSTLKSDKFVEAFKSWATADEYSGGWKTIERQYINTNPEENHNYAVLTNNGKILVNNYRTDGMRYVQGLLDDEYYLEFRYPINRAVVGEQSMKEQSLAVTESDFRIVWNRFRRRLREIHESREESIKNLEKDIEGNIQEFSSDVYLSLYNLFKALCNRWLLSMDEKRFKFTNNPERDKDSVRSICQYFVYTNSYLESVGQKQIVDINKFGDLIETYRNATVPSKSFYEFIYDIGAENGAQLLAFPFFFKLGDETADAFRELFKPLPYESGVKNETWDTDNTYIFMYPEKSSSNAPYENDSRSEDGRYNYVDDICQVVNPDGNESPLLPETFKVLNAGEKCKCFGVTFAKDNQSFFKNINVSMDNPRMTDTAIATTFSLADRFSSKANSQLISYGQNLFSLYSQYSYQCTVEMLGCARIMPLMYFQLNNIPLFRGMYIIYNVKHHITPGDMTTTFVGQRISRRRTKYTDEYGNIVLSKTAQEVDDSSISTTIFDGEMSADGLSTATGRKLQPAEVTIYKTVREYAGLTDGVEENEMVARLMALRTALTNNTRPTETVDGYSVAYQRFDPYAAYNSKDGNLNISGITANNAVYDSSYNLPTLSETTKSCLKNIETVKISGSTSPEECVFYGIWSIPGSDYRACGCKNLTSFIDEEYRGGDEQSRHFGTLLKNRGLAKYIKEERWEEFFKEYFHHNSSDTRKKKYLYGNSSSNTANKVFKELAEIVKNTKGKLKKNAAISNNGFVSRPQNDNNNSIPPFDTTAARDWLANHAFPSWATGQEPGAAHIACGRVTSGTGKCARFVTSAMAAGGITRTKNYDVNAADLLPNFTGNTATVLIDGAYYKPKDLWEEIFTTTNVWARPIGCECGDICIFEANGAHPNGHICMFMGERNGDELWASDYIQVNAWHGMSLKNLPGRYHIFRYKNRKSGSRADLPPTC